MTIAVIKTGGKQYKVAAGETIKVEKLDNKQSDGVEFTDLLTGKKVQAKIMESGKGKKVRIFKYKNKTGYRKTNGHRQPFTELKIESIA
mgnify:CR=1 FL=1